MTAPTMYNHTMKSLLVGTETTYGTGGTADKAAGLVIQDLKSGISKELIEAQGVGKLELQYLTAGVQTGEIVVTGDYQNAKLLEYVFGVVAHAATSTDTTHTFTIGAAKSAVFYSGIIGTTVTSLAYTGGLCESVEISTALNENVKMSATFKCKSPTVGTTSTAMVQSTIPTHPHSEVTITYGGAAAGIVQEASLTITRELRIVDTVGSNDHVWGAPVNFKVNFKAKLGFDSNTYHSRGKSAETASNFIFAVDNGVALGSGKRALTITVSSLTSNVEEVVTIGDLIFIDVEGTGTLSTATSVDNIVGGSW